MAKMTDEQFARIPERIEWLLRPIPYHELGSLAYELFEYAKELRAVVEKLPKTADGVPWHPRMNLWTEDGQDGGIIVGCGVVQWLVEGDGSIEEGYGPVTVRDENGNEWTTTIGDCYSIREAAEAEAAKKETL